MSENNIPDEEVAEAEEVPEVPVPEEPAEPAAAPAPKARGRPKGSKNKPKVVAVSVEEEQPPEPEPMPELRKPKRQARPKAATQAAPRVEAPLPPTPQEVAAYMLAALRQDQQARADKRRDKYTAWFS